MAKKKIDTDPLEAARKAHLQAARRHVQTEIGKRMQAARNAAGKSVDEVAHAMGLSRGAVGHWETGKNGINAAELVAYLAEIGLPPSGVLTSASGSESPPTDFTGRIAALDESNRRAVIEFLEDREARQRRAVPPPPTNMVALPAGPAQKGAKSLEARVGKRARAR
jgi:transcriptional regulator with XRE-family HTH domain